MGHCLWWLRSLYIPGQVLPRPQDVIDRSLRLCQGQRHYPMVPMKLSLSGNPFNLMRWWSFLPQPLWVTSSIFSTPHSSSLSIRSGGGHGKFSPCSFITLYGVRRLAWNTGWIFHCGGSCSLYMIGDSTCMILDGPCHLGASLAVEWLVLMFIPSNHTISPCMAQTCWVIGLVLLGLFSCCLGLVV